MPHPKDDSATGEGEASTSAGERWRQTRKILDAVLDTDPDGRRPLLEELCAGREGLRREVEELLEFEERAGQFLDSPAIPQLVPSARIVGQRVGPYRIERYLERGGMGAVFEASREDDYRQRVAIKLVPPALIGPSALRRFHTERQILARLEHPRIARLLDGGNTDDGRPFLVLEYVEGLAIDAYCDHHRSSIDQRLELFCKVCDAVAFAHRNLVVHRDLKAANILVDGEGEPKLLDFGIAKLLGDADPGLTVASERPMTPLWASPEQINDQPISTATDIYCLGLLLHRLLTGRLPCGLEECPTAELAQRILDETPSRPSIVVGSPILISTRARDAESVGAADDETSDEGANNEGANNEGANNEGATNGGASEGSTAGITQAQTIARQRRLDPKALRRRLSGDLDSIVLKALRKRPEERYASVDRLQEDVRRHLRGRPVAARRGTWLYLTTKLVQRHRWRLAIAFVLLAGLAIVAVREASHLADERRRAQSTSSFLKGLLASTDPNASGELTPRAVLDGARQRLEGFEADPILASELADILAGMYRKWGFFNDARDLLLRSVELARIGDDPLLAKRLNNLAALHMDLGEYGRAGETFRESLAVQEANGAGEQPLATVTANNLATNLLYLGHLDEAEELYRQGLERRQQDAGPESLGVAKSLHSLGALHHAKGDAAAAESYLERALEMRLDLLGEEHTAVASTLDLLGMVRLDLGQPESAEPALTRALELRLQRYEEGHTAVARSRQHLAELLMAEGELATAKLLLGQAVASLGRQLSEDDWRLAEAESLLGAAWMAEGRRAEAGPCLRNGYERLLAIRGAEAVQTQKAAERLRAWRQGETSGR